MSSYHIYIAGAGYVGLVTGACLAQKGNFVSVYEKDEHKRKILLSRRAPFLEPCLDDLLVEAMDAGHLEVVEDPISAVSKSDLSMIAVGTPSCRDGSIDISQLISACRDIAKGFRNTSSYHVIVIRSAVFPGTVSRLVLNTVERSSGKQVGLDFGLVCYPEFFREGHAIQDMLHPDRIVLGEFDKRSGDIMERIVREFYGDHLPLILRVGLSAAEMTKYASNAFIGTKIAFINEIAHLCEQLDADATQVADAMGYDHRIGRAFLNPGFGFGGPCILKDVKALVKGAKQCGVHLRVAEAAIASNKIQTQRVIDLIRELIGGLKGKRAAVLGLACKPRTDDIREAWSLKIIRLLLAAGMRVSVYDPAAIDNARSLLGKTVRYAEDIRDCLDGADCCLIATEWDEFKTIPPDLFKEMMANPVIIDGRRVLRLSLPHTGITYRVIGLKSTQ